MKEITDIVYVDTDSLLVENIKLHIRLIKDLKLKRCKEMEKIIKEQLNRIYGKSKYTAFIFDRRVMDNIGMFEIINPIPALYLYKNGKLCMQVEGDKRDLLRIKKQWEDRNV